MQNIREVISKKNNMKIGDYFEIKIKRNNEEIVLDGVLLRFLRKHVFEANTEASKTEIDLREKWIKNL